MVRYPPRAATALAFLKRHYNDVDIFVEDTGNHNMWLLIIRAMLRPGLALASVNLLGGRKAVTDACKLDQGNNGPPKLYIIDGDFDFLLGKSKQKLKFFYRIRAYCVENLIINEAALVNIGLECQPTKSEAMIAAGVDLPNFYQDVENILVPLFVVYATSNFLASEIKTIQLSLFSLLDNNGGLPIIDQKKVFSRIRKVVRQAVALSSLKEFAMVRREVVNRVRAGDVNQVVSGKDYILPLLLLRFKAVCGYKHGCEHFKVALARSYVPSVEPWLARRVRSL